MPIRAGLGITGCLSTTDGRQNPRYQHWWCYKAKTHPAAIAIEARARPGRTATATARRRLLRDPGDRPIIAAGRRSDRPRSPWGYRMRSRSTRRTSVQATILIAAAIALTACGGGTTPSFSTASDSTASGSPSSGATAPTDAPDQTTTGGEPVPSGFALPSFDLDDLVANLEGVDTYRLVMTVDGQPAFTSSVVTRPVLSRDIVMDQGGTETHIVVIGDEAWIGTGDDLQPAPPEMATSMLAFLDPMLMAGGFVSPGAMAGAEDLGVGDKNGVQAHHYRLATNPILGGLASVPPGAGIDIWVADEGYLVSLVIGTADASSLTIDVFDVNDPSITVERPG